MDKAARERVLREREGMTRRDLSDAVYAAILDLTATEVDLAAARRERDAARAEAARLRAALGGIAQVARGVARDDGIPEHCRYWFRLIADRARAALAAADMASTVTEPRS